jgi:hypothetical protein
MKSEMVRVCRHTDNADFLYRHVHRRTTLGERRAAVLDGCFIPRHIDVSTSCSPVHFVKTHMSVNGKIAVSHLDSQA